jgi:hypothetical protein
MRKTLFLFMVAVILAIFSVATSDAITVGLNPDSLDVEVGDFPTVDAVISGLGDHAPPSLSGYDMDISYDSSILFLDSVDFGTNLLVSMGGNIPTAPGVVNVFEVSLEDPVDLVANQPSSFSLFTMEFEAVETGISPLHLYVNALSDEQGNSLLVPEPATLLLLGSGLAGLRIFRRR